MRWIARYRKYINIVIIAVCVATFVYFAYLTITRTETVIDTKVYAGSAMGTAVKKTIYSDNVSLCDQVDSIIDDTLEEFEKQISVRDMNSEIFQLNKNYVVGGVNSLSDHVLQYLQTEMQIWEETKGAFSPCIYPVSSLWGIEDGQSEIPDAIQLQERLSCSDANDIELLDNGIIFHKDNMSIDFGAAGKGIACDVVKEQLMQTDIQGAVISIGGSILAYGDKGDGKDWHIGIQDPRGATGDVLGIVDVSGNVVVSTSGDYEKFFELDGKRYHHIFDPHTGYPVDNGLISVSIVSDSGLLSDVLSTACFVLGLEEGMSYAQEKGVEAIFVTDTMDVYVTKGLEKSFRMQSDAYTLKKK